MPVLRMPPPRRVAELMAMVLVVSVTCPALAIAPPAAAELFSRMRSVAIRLRRQMSIAPPDPSRPR